MCLSQPSLIVTRNGDESIFLTWSYVNTATKYEIELETTDTRIKTIYFTTSTNLFINKLENGRSYNVKVTALNNTERSEPSLGIMVRPKLRQSLSAVRAIPTEEDGQVDLKWTSTPTDFGFLVDRCDIGKQIGYKRIAWLSDNTVTTYQDRTDCDQSTHICSGHYYTVVFRDNSWQYGAGVLSKKVFCMSPAN